LARCTQRLIGSANFAKAAHLVVSWLQIQAPPKAKGHHLDALQAVCARICGERATHPAHPVLIAKISPALATLLGHEGQRYSPPITPPLVRDIVGALVQISRGLLSQADTRPPKGEALNFVDWVDIAQLVTEFCDEHGTDTNPDASKSLPGWAAETLGFVALRAHRPFAKKHAPDLDSLLTILRLLRRYRAKPAPDKIFFVWVAKQLAGHHQSASDSVTLAEIVGELVPQLPPTERSRFARQLFAKAPDATPQITTPIDVTTHVDPTAVQDRTVPLRRFLNDADSTPTGVALVAPVSASTGSSLSQSSVRAPTPRRNMDARANTGAAQNRLWDRLSPASSSQVGFTLKEVPQLPEKPVGLHADEVPLSEEPASLAMDSSERVLAESTMGRDKVWTMGVDVEAVEQATAAAVSPPLVQPPIDELRMRLEAALQRVEALEARLEEQSSGLRGEVEDLRSRTVATEVKVEAMPRHAPMAEAAALPPFPSWPPAFLPDVWPELPPQQRASVPPKSTLHVRRPFNFEEFRKSQSQGLQSERLRVLVPSDPMQPFPRK